MTEPIDPLPRDVLDAIQRSDRVEAIKEAPLGISAIDAFIRNYGGESSMGNLVADLMRALGCNQLQGYLFGRPVAAEPLNATAERTRRATA